MLQQMIDRLFSNPVIFNKMRLILDNNFFGEREIILKELDVRKRTLDIACGTGDFSVLFGRDKYLGVDISPKYIAYARRKHARTFLVMDAQKINLDGGSFDNILLIGSLHHMSSQAIIKILAEMNRLLKHKGTALIIEDAPVRRKSNILGRLVQYLDTGKAVRAPADYRELFGKFFKVRKSYLGHSGINEFCVFVLKKWSQKNTE